MVGDEVCRGESPGSWETGGRQLELVRGTDAMVLTTRNFAGSLLAAKSMLRPRTFQ